jgi:hypothetical protein
MLVARKKCWAGSVKKWLFKNQPQEVAGFLPLVQPPLETTPQPAMAHALQVKELTVAHALQARTAQPSLGIAHGITHIHLT